MPGCPSSHGNRWNMGMDAKHDIGKSIFYHMDTSCGIMDGWYLIKSRLQKTAVHVLVNAVPLFHGQVAEVQQKMRDWCVGRTLRLTLDQYQCVPVCNTLLCMTVLLINCAFMENICVAIDTTMILTKVKALLHFCVSLFYLQLQLRSLIALCFRVNFDKYHAMI